MVGTTDGSASIPAEHRAWRPADTQVIVVGAGPVGLMLAGELRLGGARVVVLERLDQPTTESRASTLHARTMEVFDSRGLLGAFGQLPSDTRGHFGGVPLDLTLTSLYPGQWKVPQTRTEAVLSHWAAVLGADVRRGHEVTDLVAGPDGVEVGVLGPAGPTRLRAEWLVACDGERSTVRRLVGAGLTGRPAHRWMIRADVSGVRIADRRFQRLPRGLAIASRRSDGVTRVMVHEFDRALGTEDRASAGEPAPGGPSAGEALTFEEVWSTWLRVTGEDLSGATPLWMNRFGDESRQLTRYRHGRILFAGDAAHTQMPVGGQALNLGLQDAVNLGWKLALRVAGRVGDELIDSYHDERHAVGARVLRDIRAQALLLLGGPEVEPMRDVLAELLQYDPVRRRLAGVISGLDPRVGDRIPPARLVTAAGPTNAPELLRSGRGLLLAPDGDAVAQAAVRRVHAPWADRVDLVVGRLSGDPTAPMTRGDPAGHLESAALVRPDGIVAWASGWFSGSYPAGLAQALTRWFGAPRPAAHTPIPIPEYTPSHERRETMSRLTGKVALVTGASRGIGRGIAVRLARDGALVAVHYGTNKDAAEEVVNSIEGDGGRAFAVRADLGQPGDAHEMFLGLEYGLKERVGSTDLHVLVNNAGVMGGVAATDTTPEQFDRLFAVNARAPFFIIQRAMANLVDGGRIINISSGLTRFANPEEIAYAMTKGAVEQLTLHFAKLLAPRGITVNSVAPGITRNGASVFGIPEAVERMAALSAFNRVGEPEDVADVVAFLASGDARWITGSFVDASGGTLLG